ncbi:29753_t:CDS:1, partial [Racocetra persica]
MNFSSKEIENLQKLINKIKKKNELLLKEKNECEKINLNNQQNIEENKKLQEKDFENKIVELRQEIHGAKRELSGWTKHNNLDRENTLINESLNNFKIVYNNTNSLETKMDLLIEI